MNHSYKLQLNLNDDYHVKINEFIINNHLEECFIKDLIYNNTLLLKNAFLLSDSFICRISSYVTFHKYEREFYDRKFGHGNQSQQYNLKTIILNMWR